MGAHETPSGRRWLAWLLVLILLAFFLARWQGVLPDASQSEPPTPPGLVVSG